MKPIAAETLKRYPWANKSDAVMAAPHFVFNGSWAIKPDGAISINPNIPDWANGDIGQRSVSLLCGMIDYYRYSGDPAAIGIISLTADYVLENPETGDEVRRSGAALLAEGLTVARPARAGGIWFYHRV